MNRKIIVNSLVVTSVIFITGCASKCHKGDFKNTIFAKFDRNKDSKLSKKEHFNMLLSRFERIDDNRDGKLSKKELKDSKFTNMKSNFSDYYLKKYDLNRDGEVIRSELIEQSKKEFSNLDRNSDGFISKTEFKKQKSPFKK